MIVKLYAVLDKASGVYDGPVPCNADGVALRNFRKMAFDDKTPIGQSPSDYSLWRVGSWNDADGSIESDGKECLAYAVDLLYGDNEE